MSSFYIQISNFRTVSIDSHLRYNLSDFLLKNYIILKKYVNCNNSLPAATSFIVYPASPEHKLKYEEGECVDMELFTVCLLPSNEQEVWKLSRYLSEAFAPLHMAAGSDVLKWDIDAGQGRISCFELPGISSPPLARADVIRQAAEGIADFILYELEPALLRTLMQKESGYADAAELQKKLSVSAGSFCTVSIVSRCLSVMSSLLTGASVIAKYLRKSAHF